MSASARASARQKALTRLGVRAALIKGVVRRMEESYFGEVTNADRAEYARVGLDAFALSVRDEQEDFETQASDLLADLMHLCDEESEFGAVDGIPSLFTKLVERASANYEEERDEELAERRRR